MSFMTCELRCHILDRKDQLESCKDHRRYQKKRKQELLEAINKAQEEYDKFLKYVERREKFIALVESTLHKDWIDRPDFLEKEWFAE